MRQRYEAWATKLEETYWRKGYIVPEDLGCWLWLARLILWASVKFGDMILCSCVVSDDKVICFNNRVLDLRNHALYPKAHIENRYTTDLDFFRARIWPDPDFDDESDTF